MTRVKQSETFLPIAWLRQCFWSTMTVVGFGQSVLFVLALWGLLNPTIKAGYMCPVEAERGINHLITTPLGIGEQ